MIGELFLGKYRIERLVGSGGMGAVYAAMDIDLQRRVAIKVLLPEIARSHAASARFVREGRAAARVEGDHVARVFGAGRTPEGVAYVILELLDGRDLGEELRVRGRLRIVEAVDILRQALEGVAEAHHQGIVHRDLKPANLFLHRRSNGTRVVKVLDFGISKANHPQEDGDEGELLTMTKTMLGSPFYMSPEQLLDSRTVDHRTDIWSLGIVLHEMLAGVHPFESESLAGIVDAILHREVPPLGPIRPEVPIALQVILARCLERDPARRLADAAEISSLLAPFAVEVDDTLEVAAMRRSYEPSTEGERASIEVETRVWSPRPPPVAMPAPPPTPRALPLLVVIAVPAAIVFFGLLLFLYVLRPAGL